MPSLLPLDHSTIQYDEFNKEFYEEHPEISSMKEEDVTNYRKQLGMASLHTHFRLLIGD